MNALDRKLGDITERDLGQQKIVFFLCDMQEKFRPAMLHFDEIIEVVKKMVDAAKILEIPLIVTEQYPKGLGNTLQEIDISHAGQPISKTQYTMMVDEVRERLKMCCNGDVRHIVIFGVETHVCVQQTVIDLLKEEKYAVHVIADGCTSRTQMDRKFALERFRQMGAIVTTSDAMLQQLIGGKDHPKFKDVQKLIKVLPPDSGL